MSIVTIEDIKAHLSIDPDVDDDALLAGKIAAAEGWVASYIGYALDDAEQFPNGTPEPLKEAVRMLVAYFYNNRGASIGRASIQTDIPGIFDLMSPYRDWTF